MKKTLLPLLLTISLFASQIDKPFMTKQMLENDLETNEYQLFFTKTRNIPLDNLKAKVIFSGTLSDYYNFFKKDMIKNLNISNETLHGATTNALNSLSVSAKNSLLTKESFKNAGRDFGISLLMQPISIGLFGDDNYVQVTDYYDNDIPKTRVIKYVVSDEALPEEELQMIFSSTNDRSYHFNRGKAASAFSQKDYRKFRKTHNRSQK